MRRAALVSAAFLLAACSSDSETTAPTDTGSTLSEPSVPAVTDVTTSTVVEVTDPAPTTTTAPLSPTLEDWACPPDAPAGAACHRLVVPADWSTRQGSTISLPILVLPAKGPTPQPDPIVIPAGGPGFEAVPDAGYWSSSPLNQARDIVLYDQRGTGQAEPSLACPERDEEWVANLQRNEPFEVERASILDGLGTCRTRLEALGVDMDDYDSEASALDLDAIRDALGYAQWNLLGISYGARLSLTAIRSTPDAIRSVILDSIYDVTAGGIGQTALNAERAFQQLADGCAADATCHAAHPDVAAAITAVRDRYNAAPIEVDVDLGDAEGPERFVITGDDALGGLFNALYDASLIPLLPGILDALAAGDTGIVPELIRRGAPFATGAADAMTLSVDCADNAGLGDELDRAAVADPGRTRLLVTDALCSEWPVQPTSATYNEPVVSDLPALVLAGLYDPVTPPAGTEAVADRLTNATFGLWPNQGHGVTGEECAITIELAFLADPSVPPDMSCLAGVPGPAFS